MKPTAERKGARHEFAMDIGTLALVTLGLVLLFGFIEGGAFLKDRRNRGAAKNVFRDDGESATTKVRPNVGPAEGTLKERLDS